jgi:CBS-domain-containing membrane protein
MMRPPAERAETQHPILVNRVVHADGTYTLAFRIKCDVRNEAVPIDACRECGRCLEIGGDATGSQSWVRCTGTRFHRSTSLSVGDALHEGTIAVDETVSIRDVVALFVERGLHSLIVTDLAGRVMGAVREEDLLPHIPEQGASESTGIAPGWKRTWNEPARHLMSPVRCVYETTSLRHALGLMATRRDRQIVVVDPHGAPVGTLCDTEALHVLHAKAHTSTTAPDRR